MVRVMGVVMVVHWRSKIMAMVMVDRAMAVQVMEGLLMRVMVAIEMIVQL